MKGLGSISIVTSSSKGAFLALCGNCCSWFCIRYSGAAKNFKRGAMMNLQRTKNWASIANLAFDLLVRDPPQFVLQHPRRRLAPFERPGCCWINLLIVLFYRGQWDSLFIQQPSRTTAHPWLDGGPTSGTSLLSLMRNLAGILLPSIPSDISVSSPLKETLQNVGNMGLKLCDL